MENSKSKIKIGILASSSLQLAIMGVAVAIAPMIAHFTDVSPTMIMLIVTIPSLVCIPVQLIVGANAAKVGKKVPLLLGIAIIAISGLTPAFIDVSFPMLLAVSVGIGVGNGLLIPTSTGLITDHFEGIEAGGLMGLQSAFINLGAMILSVIGGFLCVSGWRNAFFIYVYAIIMGVIVFICVPKDKKYDASSMDASAQKPKLSKEVMIISAIIIIFGLCIGIGNTNNSVLVAEKGLGDPSVAGIAGSAMTGIGILIGISYGKLIGILKKWALPIAFIAGATGLFIVSISTSPIIFYIGAGLSGVGLSLAMPTGLFRCTNSVEQNAATFAISIFLAAVNIGLFLTPVVLNPLSAAIADGSAQSRFLIGSIILAVLSIYVFFHVRKDPD